MFTPKEYLEVVCMVEECPIGDEVEDVAKCLGSGEKMWADLLRG